MFKRLFFSFLVLGMLNSLEAKVEMRWLTVASVVIDDGTTRIMFDPMFSRAGMLNWLNFSKLKSDEGLVQQVLKKQDLMKVDAVFASHSHFDHVIDAPVVAKLTGATFYVDQSSERIAKAYKDPKIQTQLIKNHDKIKIGAFTVTIIRRTHSHIKLIGTEYLPGEVPKDFDFDFFDYHVGDTWFYLIEHPEGTILVDQGSEPFIENLKPFATKADAVIQGIANRKNDDSILKGYVEFLKPKIFIPAHFDNFFFAFTSGEPSNLPGVRLQELMEKFKTAHPQMKAITPKYGEKIQLL